MNRNDKKNVLDQHVHKFCEYLYESAYKIFGKTIMQHENYDKKYPKNSWFSNECKDQKKIYNEARNSFRRNPNATTKTNYFRQRSKYNSILRKYKYKIKKR